MTFSPETEDDEQGEYMTHGDRKPVLHVHVDDVGPLRPDYHELDELSNVIDGTLGDRYEILVTRGAELDLTEFIIDELADRVADRLQAKRIAADFEAEYADFETNTSEPDLQPLSLEFSAMPDECPECNTNLDGDGACPSCGWEADE